MKMSISARQRRDYGSTVLSKARHEYQENMKTSLHSRIAKGWFAILDLVIIYVHIIGRQDVMEIWGTTEPQEFNRSRVQRLAL